jgi:hypothetical protein
MQRPTQTYTYLFNEPSLCFSVASSLTQLEGSNPATMALVEEPRIDESSQEKISNRPM